MVGGGGEGGGVEEIDPLTPPIMTDFANSPHPLLPFTEGGKWDKYI
jgi:hypothetical protein